MESHLAAAGTLSFAAWDRNGNQLNYDDCAKTIESIYSCFSAAIVVLSVILVSFSSNGSTHNSHRFAVSRLRYLSRWWQGIDIIASVPPDTPSAVGVFVCHWYYRPEEATEGFSS